MRKQSITNTFIHHYLFDSLVSVVLSLLAVQKVYQQAVVYGCNSNIAMLLAISAGLLAGVFYWFIFRKIYIKTVLCLYKQFDRVIIRHIERKGINRWVNQHENELNNDTYNELPESRKAKALAFALDLYKAEQLRNEKMKAEAENKLKRVRNYSKQTLLLLGFGSEDIYKICNLVEFFVTTRSVIHSSDSIARHNDVSMSEVKNFVANIADLYGIDNPTAALFVSEVFKEWCVWTDTQGNLQRTEVATIAKTLRTTKGKLRILPESILLKG